MNNFVAKKNPGSDSFRTMLSCVGGGNSISSDALFVLTTDINQFNVMSNAIALTGGGVRCVVSS